jgi:hypothetical protein
MNVLAKAADYHCTQRSGYTKIIGRFSAIHCVYLHYIMTTELIGLKSQECIRKSRSKLQIICYISRRFHFIIANLSNPAVNPTTLINSAMFEKETNTKERRGARPVEYRLEN